MESDKLNQTQHTQFANTVQVRASDRPFLTGITGREDDRDVDAASPAAMDVAQLDAQPRSDVTDQYQAGMGANETADGLSGTEEAVRAAAEDETEGDEFEKTPVFDRADIIPKII